MIADPEAVAVLVADPDTGRAMQPKALEPSALERMKAKNRQRAEKVRGNPAIEQLLRSALNSSTDVILGWTELP